MNHPAIKELFELVPTFKHKELEAWVKEWIKSAYATSTIDLHIVRDNEFIEAAKKTTRKAVAELVTEQAVSKTDRSREWPAKEVLVTSYMFVLRGEG